MAPPFFLRQECARAWRPDTVELTSLDQDQLIGRGRMPFAATLGTSYRRMMHTPRPRLQLALFASLAGYEREVINERVKAGVLAAKARGVQFGKPAPKAETVETQVRLCRQMMAEGMSSTESAEAVKPVQSGCGRASEAESHGTATSCIWDHVDCPWPAASKGLLPQKYAVKCWSSGPSRLSITHTLTPAS